MKKIIIFLLLAVIGFSIHHIFSGYSESKKAENISQKKEYSPALQKRLDAFKKADDEVFKPWFKVILSIPDEKTLYMVYRVISEEWWKRHIAKGWEKQDERIPENRDEMLESISLRLQWLCHNEAIKNLKK